MATFRGTVKGSRGKASRLGHRNSGLVTECNTWDAGVRCEARQHSDDSITIDVYMTGGSNGGESIPIGYVRLKPSWTKPEFLGLVSPVIGRGE